MSDFSWLHEIGKYDNRNAVTTGDWSMTYSLLLDSARLVGRAIIECGAKPGDCVMTLLKNSPGAVAAVQGIFLDDTILVPQFPDLPVNALKPVLTKCRPSCILIDNIKYLEELQNVVFEMGFGIVFIERDPLNNAVKCNIVKYYNGDPVTRISQEDVCEVLFTSGSTGLPKGVMLTKLNVQHCIAGISKYMNIQENDKFLITKPLAHASSLNGELLLGLSSGVEIIIESHWITPKKLAKIIIEKEITVFFTVPTILELLRKNNELKRIAENSSLRIIHFYGAPASEDLIRYLMENMPDIELFYGYGLTEAAPRVTYIDRENLSRKLKSSGRHIDGVNVYIVKPDGSRADFGEHGEIVVDGPTVMAGYVNDPELTEQRLKEGRLYTGDIGWMDNDGFLYVCGRKDDLIIRGGLNIYPAEVENVLLQHPDIQAALVAGEDDQFGDSRISAYIETANNINVPLSEIFNFCRERLDPRKVPTYIQIVDKLERTASGKIKRKIKM